MKEVHFSTGSGKGIYFVPSFHETNGLLQVFLGRRGGVSAPPFDTLNFSFKVGDDPASVETNLAILEEIFGIDKNSLIIAEQVHSTNVEVVTGEVGKRYVCDALITSKRGVALGVLTADCSPIIISGNGFIAVIHGGWRGVLKGVIENCLSRLIEEFDADLSSCKVAIGPTICGNCLSFKKDSYPEILSLIGERESSCIKTDDNGSISLDLPDLIKKKMLQNGFTKEHIDISSLCPSCLPELFFSHRRSGGKTGRQLSFAMMR